MQNTTTATTTNFWPHARSGACACLLRTAKKATWRSAWLGVPLWLSFAAPAQNTSPAYGPPPTMQATPISAGFSPAVKNIPISPGDLLDVEVFNTPELSSHLRVDQMGRITLPLGGEVEAQGLTVAAAANAIKLKLVSAQIMLHPAVSVNISEYATQGVTVMGEVHSPGIYTLLGPHSLYDALASAGGVGSSAGSSITITRAEDATHPIIVKVTSPNYSAVQKATIIEPGDTIVVSKADLVYIVGEVNRSGAFYMQNGQPLTVLNLVSLAQGTTRVSAMSRVSIVRPTPNGGAVTLRLNLNKVMKNQETNIALEAGDILVVPRSGLKSFGMTALPAVTSAVTSAVAVSLEAQ